MRNLQVFIFKTFFLGISGKLETAKKNCGGGRIRPWIKIPTG
jgi:hypothetical protein